MTPDILTILKGIEHSLDWIGMVLFLILLFK